MDPSVTLLSFSAEEQEPTTAWPATPLAAGGGIAVTSFSPSRVILTPFQAKSPQHYYEKIDQHIKLYHNPQGLQ